MNQVLVAKLALFDFLGGWVDHESSTNRKAGITGFF